MKDTEKAESYHQNLPLGYRIRRMQLTAADIPHTLQDCAEQDTNYEETLHVSTQPARCATFTLPAFSVLHLACQSATFKFELQKERDHYLFDLCIRYPLAIPMDTAPSFISSKLIREQLGDKMHSRFYDSSELNRTRIQFDSYCRAGTPHSTAHHG